MGFNYQNLIQSFENVIYLKIIKYDYFSDDFLILIILFKFFEKLVIIVALKTKCLIFTLNEEVLKMFKTNHDD